MTSVGFYKLTRSATLTALTNLLTRTLAAGQRAVVLCGSVDGVQALSDALWRTPIWLPHGTAKDGDASIQPVWLTHEAVAPNGGRYLFQIDGASATKLDGYDRVFDIFDGTDQIATAAARQRWNALRHLNYSLSYWDQTEAGWEKKYEA